MQSRLIRSELLGFTVLVALVASPAHAGDPDPIFAADFEFGVACAWSAAAPETLLDVCPRITAVSPDPALAGGQITIDGQNFGANQGAGGVLYDGAALSVVSWSAVAIEATLLSPKPVGTYVVDVVVMNLGEASASHTINSCSAGECFVPAGPFTMGSDAVTSDERPVHVVDLDAFYIDETEVTVSAFAECVGGAACAVPNMGVSCNWNASDRGDHPVNCVSWHDAEDYCAWAAKRLPTEAEWEKAGRGGTDERTYPWGEATASCTYAVLNDGGQGCGAGSTGPVGSKPAGDSPLGAQDMAGNVWEWVNDWYHSDYYDVSPLANPPGPVAGEFGTRVLRGGSWSSTPGNVRVANRFTYSPLNRVFNVGFRCARDG